MCGMINLVISFFTVSWGNLNKKKTKQFCQCFIYQCSSGRTTAASTTTIIKTGLICSKSMRHDRCSFLLHGLSHLQYLEGITISMSHVYNLTYNRTHVYNLTGFSLSRTVILFWIFNYNSVDLILSNSILCGSVRMPLTKCREGSAFH